MQIIIFILLPPHYFNSVKEEEEIAAKTEMVYDPVERVYDARRMKVTNLPENNRITLPRPLKPIHEAEIEVRKETWIQTTRK